MIFSFEQFLSYSFLFETVIASESSFSVISHAPAYINKIHAGPGYWSAAADFASCWSYTDQLFGANSMRLVLVLSSDCVDPWEY